MKAIIKKLKIANNFTILNYNYLIFFVDNIIIRKEKKRSGEERMNQAAISVFVIDITNYLAYCGCGLQIALFFLYLCFTYGIFICHFYNKIFM